MEIILDGRFMVDRDSLHTHIAEKLSFPSYYGRNLDALYDLLSSYPEKAEIVLVHGDDLITALGKYGNAFVKTLMDACRANQNLELSFSNEIF